MELDDVINIGQYEPIKDHFANASTVFWTTISKYNGGHGRGCCKVENNVDSFTHHVRGGITITVGNPKIKRRTS